MTRTMMTKRKTARPLPEYLLPKTTGMTTRMREDKDDKDDKDEDEEDEDEDDEDEDD